MAPRTTYRRGLDPDFSEGARLLWRVRDRFSSQSKLAETIGVGRSVLNRWLYGDCKPSSLFRHALEDLFHIPSRAWDIEPQRGFVVPALRTGTDG